MTPDTHAIAVMGLTVFALFLFTRDRIPLQTSALVILCLLAIGFEVVPYQYDTDLEKNIYFNSVELFHGFGHEALVAVCALMIMGSGLVKTGVIFASAIILYTLTFSLDDAYELVSPRVLRPLAALGVLIYGAVGFFDTYY